MLESLYKIASEQPRVNIGHVVPVFDIKAYCSCPHGGYDCLVEALAKPSSKYTFGRSNDRSTTIKRADWIVFMTC